MKAWVGACLGFVSRDKMAAEDGLPTIPVHSIAYDDARQLLPYVYCTTYDNFMNSCIREIESSKQRSVAELMSCAIQVL